MVPTLRGRIETRIFILAVIGSLWTLLITPLLPVSAPLGDKYHTTYTVLAVVLVLGIGWEFVYHALMQFRWEKDWPALFGFFTAIPEGILVWIVMSSGAAPGDVKVTGAAFLIHFATTWVVCWIFVNGPMRVLTIHWRFRGGRLL